MVAFVGCSVGLSTNLWPIVIQRRHNHLLSSDYRFVITPSPRHYGASKIPHKITFTSTCSVHFLFVQHHLPHEQTSLIICVWKQTQVLLNLSRFIQLKLTAHLHGHLAWDPHLRLSGHFGHISGRVSSSCGIRPSTTYVYFAASL